MLQRLRKRIGDFITSGPAAPTEPTTSTLETPPAKLPQASSPEPDADLVAKLARREAQRREARLMLSERIQNRAATLMSELRNQLLIESHHALDNEAGTTTLKGLLQVALDADFLRSSSPRQQHSPRSSEPTGIRFSAPTCSIKSKSSRCRSSGTCFPKVARLQSS
jgi:hypothetical protein